MKKYISILLILAVCALSACSVRSDATAASDRSSSAVMTETADIVISDEDTAKERTAVSSEIANIIEEQSFEISLNQWGRVRFVSIAPDSEAVRSDVIFSLVKAGHEIYTFPEYFEDNESPWVFESVDAVAFEDINKDGQDDVIVIVSYITGVGAEAVIPFKTTRIFMAAEQGYDLDKERSLMVDDNHANENIRAILDYLMETSTIGS